MYRIVVIVIGFCVVLLGGNEHETVYAEDRPHDVKTLKPGVSISLFAEQPQVVTPTGIDVDEKGNVWVVSSHTHFPPEDYPGPKFDEILKFDSEGNRTVFYNATHHTMDLELGPDGWVYLAERSRILRIRDSDQNGQAEEVEELALLKTEAVYPHNGLAGLCLTNEGQLLLCLGENFSHPWQLTGTDNKQLSGSSEGAVFVMNLDGSGLKRLARGLWNPFGICVRQNGEMFAVDNDPGERPPCRLVQIVQGGDYGFQRKYGSEAHHPFVCWNGQLSATLPMVHPVGEAPCGIVPYGRGLLAPSWGEHHVRFYPLTPSGTGYQTDPIELVKGGRYFRPVCIAENRAEQRAGVRSWFMTDWVDGSYNVHGFGRIWKLEIDTEKATWLGPTELLPPNEETQIAQQLRAGQFEYPLNEMLLFSTHEGPYLAQATLQGLSKLAPNWTIDEAKTKSEELQHQMLLALRLAAFENQKSIQVTDWIDYFLTMNDPRIQFETLRLISDLELKQYLPKVEAILTQSELSYELFEAAIATVNTLNGKPELGVRNEEQLLKKVQDEKSSPQLRAYALRLLPAPQRKATDNPHAPRTNFPKGLTLKLLEQLLSLKNEELSVEVVRTLEGNPVLSEKLLVAISNDENQSTNVRLEAIAALANIASKNTELLLKLALSQERSLREEALRSLRSVQLSQEARQRLQRIGDDFPESEDLVMAALEPGSLKKNRPALDDISGWEERLKRVPGLADIAAGRRLFHQSSTGNCSSCHRHEGRGNMVGPDLTSVHQNEDLNWLLESILQPSRQMSPEFRPTMILLEDGRSFSGIRLQSYTKEAIRDAHGRKRVFDKSEIEMIQDLKTSFMPEGLVYNLTDRELRDLVVFLRSEER